MHSAKAIGTIVKLVASFAIGNYLSLSSKKGSKSLRFKGLKVKCFAKLSFKANCLLVIKKFVAFGNAIKANCFLGMAVAKECLRMMLLVAEPSKDSG